MADSSREFLLEMTDICKSFPGVKALTMSIYASARTQFTP